MRHALRSLVLSPGFSAAVILTLALGIGANTAVFSVLRGVLLRPLPHRHGDQLLYLRQSATGSGQENIHFFNQCTDGGFCGDEAFDDGQIQGWSGGALPTPG